MDKIGHNNQIKYRSLRQSHTDVANNKVVCEMFTFLNYSRLRENKLRRVQSLLSILWSQINGHLSPTFEKIEINFRQFIDHDSSGISFMTGPIQFTKTYHMLILLSSFVSHKCKNKCILLTLFEKFYPTLCRILECLHNLSNGVNYVRKIQRNYQILYKTKSTCLYLYIYIWVILFDLPAEFGK